MFYYQAVVQYDGTGRAGFQWQKDAPTIQDDINQALTRLLGGRLSTVGASRTDTGVHALHQVIKITSENPIQCENFLTPFNQALPREVRCLQIAPCDTYFSPMADTLSKEYRYFFTNKAETTEAERRFVANIAKPLNLENMKACVAMIPGTHDFQNFCSTGSNVKTTIRTVAICEFSKINPHEIFANSPLFNIPTELTECFQLRFVADGFLKQMIRHLVRGLWMVGSEKLTPEEFKTILTGPKIHKQLWRVAHANGLYLYQIKYT